MNWDKIMSSVAHEDRGFDSPCWIWKRGLSGGYASSWNGDRVTNVHREVYVLVHGDICDGIEVHHRCEQKSCVNPEHLEALTVIEHKRRHGYTATQFIEDELAKGPCSREELVRRAVRKGFPKSTIDVAMYRSLNRGVVERSGGKWTQNGMWSLCAS